MALRNALLIAVCVLIFAPWNADAVTWSLKNMTTSDDLNLLPRNHVDPDSADAVVCDSPGTCIPYSIKLPIQTVWYWCGWKTIDRSRYIVKVSNSSKDANFTALLMRSKDLFGCTANGLADFKNCPQIAFSLCDTVSSCTLQVTGLAFPDDVCFVLAVNGNSTVNKNRNSSTISFQFYNFYDSPRYYGTVFSIILTILGLGCILTYLGYTCYTDYNAPSDRIHEFRSLEALLAAKPDDGNKDSVAVQLDDEDSKMGAFKDRVKGAMNKVKASFRRKDMS